MTFMNCVDMFLQIRFDLDKGQIETKFLILGRSRLCNFGTIHMCPQIKLNIYLIGTFIEIENNAYIAQKLKEYNTGKLFLKVQTFLCKKKSYVAFSTVLHYCFHNLDYIC